MTSIAEAIGREIEEEMLNLIFMIWGLSCFSSFVKMLPLPDILQSKHSTELISGDNYPEINL